MTDGAWSATVARGGVGREPRSSPSSAVAEQSEQSLPVLLRLALADPLDREQFGGAARASPCQLAQRAVVEDDVRRHAALAGDLAAQRAQRLEQRLVRLAR